MACIALQLIEMISDIHHGRARPIRVLPPVFHSDAVEGRDFEVESAGGVNDHLIPFSNHIAERVAPCGQQITVFHGCKSKPLVKEVSGFGCQPALVRHDGFLLFTVGDPNNVLSSRFIQS